MHKREGIISRKKIPLIDWSLIKKHMAKLLSIGILIGLILYFPIFNNQNTPAPVEEKVSKPVLASKPADPDSLNKTQFYPTITQDQYDHIFRNNIDFSSDGFDFPVGKPDAEGYFKALNFGQRLHLGEDWNGKGGGNTDLGDPVYSAANGLVVYADDICCGWGNTIRVIHFLPYHSKYKYVETIYSHLHNIHVKAGDLVLRGDKIGTIGNAKGRYSAHLHFEMRDFINMSIGPGYSEDKFGYLNPTAFIEENRP